ncbi:unnamed protein product [Rodentolepis nana]|uniref:B3_4 domain-containing protein n=1 Tax=Rodentolepis nana TaxID=102285 RepID=A0A0R3T5K1_RODNA|nr:unnamed protein product [Rodentolepis nana]
MAWPEITTARRENRRELVVSNRDNFDPSVYTLTQLNFLDISKCPLYEIADDLSDLTALSKLSLQHDEIVAVPLGIGQLLNLKFLDLSFNSISNLPSNIFDNLSLLETLILDSNKLSELPSFKGLIELHIFSVSNNKLLCLPDTLTCCTKLKSVDASGNNIKEISDEVPWSSLSNLQHFYLNGNQLKEVPLGLTECKRLRDLQLKENPLQDARLKKLAASDRGDAGNVLMNYLLKISKGKKELAKTLPHDAIPLAPTSAPIENVKILSMIESDDSDFRIDVLRPGEVKKSLRPHIFGCVISGVSLHSEGLIRAFSKFQSKLHAKLCDNRKLATFSTHTFEAVKMPLEFSLQPIDTISCCPMNIKRSVTGLELLANLQNHAELERKKLKLNNYSASMQYLLLISPLLGPRMDPINLKKAAEIAPLPVTTDLTGNIISLHPITACYKTCLTTETTRVLIEVAGVSDMVCKNIMRKLIEWLVQNAVPVGEGERAVTITPLAVVDDATGDRLAKFPLEVDIMDPDFLNSQAE